MQGSRSVKRPAVGFRGVGPREDEALGIDGDARGQPVGPGLCADEDEHRRAIEVAGTPVLDVAEPEPRDRAVALDGIHLDVADDLDLLVALDPAGEVVGHALAQVAPAQRSVAPAVCSARNITACPAELPPPTTAARPFRHDRACTEVQE